MANQGQKTKRWTAQDEYKLIKNVEKHVLCLTKAFEATSKEIQRSPKAVQAHWYMKTSKYCGRTLFMTVSGKHVAVNRKNAKGQPIRVPIYKRLLSILGLSY
jgi:hypothetical protein